MDKRAVLLFGAAYYDEYMPCERLEQDMKMMSRAGFNTIRIAESTWSVEEPQPNVYNFTHIDRVIHAAARYGINVIIGTPTYAVPSWLVQLDEDVLVTSKEGKALYGRRQNMDITNPTYLHYAEGMIRALVSHTAACPNVIGYQIDNETKHYGVGGPKAVERFRGWLKERFGTIEAVNEAFGLAHWSTSAASFEQLPDPAGTVNGSYACAYAQFQRELAEEFLRWQAGIVREYLRPDQFITHNFDFEWRFFGPDGQQDGYSAGIQPDIDHFEAAKVLTLTGTDIYCPAQDSLTGLEISFGGDEMRCLRHAPYLVLESQAQAFKEFLPYPGQLRLMVYSHLATGACGIMYWPWHSIHNGLESYWKGILSHDLQPNETYEEICQIGAELQCHAAKLSGLKKNNRIALLVSVNAINALKCFPTAKELCANDVILWLYRALYELNLECDIVYEQSGGFAGYDMLVVPQLYAVRSETIEHIRSFVANGGTVFATFRSFVCDEYAKIFHDPLPHGLTDVFGMTYDQDTKPVNVTVAGAKAEYWMELLRPLGAETVSCYEHKYWGKYAVVTHNRFGKGHAWYLGTMLPLESLKPYVLAAAASASISITSERWPVIIKNGMNTSGQPVHFVFNYSSTEATILSHWDGLDLLTGHRYGQGDEIRLPDWGVAVIVQEPNTL